MSNFCLVKIVGEKIVCMMKLNGYSKKTFSINFKFHHYQTTQIQGQSHCQHNRLVSLDHPT